MKDLTKIAKLLNPAMDLNVCNRRKKKTVTAIWIELKNVKLYLEELDGNFSISIHRHFGKQIDFLFRTVDPISAAIQFENYWIFLKRYGYCSAMKNF